MKIAVFGLEDFPLGKNKLPDFRIDALKVSTNPAKTTYIQIEFIDEQNLKDADGIVALDTKKADVALLDLELIETRLSRSESETEKNFLLRLQKELEQEHFLRNLSFNEEEKSMVSTLNFITIKPILFISQEDSSDLDSLMLKMFKAAGMISFITVGQKELRVWDLKHGLNAHDAAGCIHSDIQRGFIKAEVFNYKDVESLGDIRDARLKAMHLEEKEYIVEDGDILNFRFNV